MGDILITGNIGMIANAMLNKIESNGKIVLCGETSVESFKDKRVVVYPYRDDDKEYRGIFKSYNFETVLYFSRVLDGQKRLLDELEKLENNLYSAALSGVKHFIYVTTNDYMEQQTETTRTKLLKTCEDICKQFVDESDINVLVLRIPYIYTIEETQCKLSRLVKMAKEQNEIVLDSTEQRLVDFINDEDLGDLISRICDEPSSGFRIADVTGGNEMEMARLGELVAEETGVSELRYCGYHEAVPKSRNDGSMRQYYGWFPTHLLEDDIADVVATLGKNENQVKKNRIRRIRNEKIRNFLFIAVEMTFMFLASELLISWTSDNYRMDYVDFRLLFVIIMGTMHGTGAGIIASILASLGYFARDVMQSNWQIIFFNIENWLPFAAYFLSGTIVGHVRDKNQDVIRFQKEQQDILENKYNFLSNLYAKTLENKEEYSRQIIGYEDSFGRLYQVVRKLNSTMTDNIFIEAVFSIEEILKTTSVAIYSIGENSHFARLNVCSREINERLSKSLDLNLYPAMAESLMQNQNWYNAEGFPEHPAYVAPVWKDEKLCGAIMIWNVRADQMKMDYYNKFSIMSGLVQDALIRAIEYGEQQAATQMIEGTKVLKPEYFEEILSLKEKMGKEGMSDFTLLEIVTHNLTLQQIGEIVTAGIRNTDMVGMRNDEKVYLLLNQTNEKSLEIVRKRLEPKGIKLQKK